MSNSNSNVKNAVEFIKVIMIVAVAIYLVGKAVYEIALPMYNRFFRERVEEVVDSVKEEIVISVDSITTAFNEKLELFIAQHNETIETGLDFHARLVAVVLEVANQVEIIGETIGQVRVTINL